MINLFKSFLNKKPSSSKQPLKGCHELAGKLVASIPPDTKQEFRSKLPDVITTFECFNELFKSANRIIKIFSPFVDPTFTSFIYPVKCPIRIITTTEVKRGYKGNSCLERCAIDRDLQVRYIVQKKSKMHMFQMHAKLILIDSKIGYVGSANLTDTSIHYNFELGVMVSEEKTIRELNRMFDFLFECVSVPAELVRA